METFHEVVVQIVMISVICVGTLSIPVTAAILLIKEGFAWLGFPYLIICLFALIAMVKIITVVIS